MFWLLGALDERYFAHQEEIDLCWRAFNAGYKAKYIPTSKVYHVGGATLNHAHPRKTFFNFRNSLYNLVKNKQGNYVLVVFMRLILDSIAGLKFLVDGQPKHTWAILRAHVSFYKNIGYCLKKRRNISPKKANYYHTKNLVWQHFILKNKIFTDFN